MKKKLIFIILTIVLTATIYLLILYTTPIKANDKTTRIINQNLNSTYTWFDTYVEENRNIVTTWYKNEVDFETLDNGVREVYLGEEIIYGGMKLIPVLFEYNEDFKDRLRIIFNITPTFDNEGKMYTILTPLDSFKIKTVDGYEYEAENLFLVDNFQIYKPSKYERVFILDNLDLDKLNYLEFKLKDETIKIYLAERPE